MTLEVRSLLDHRNDAARRSSSKLPKYFVGQAHIIVGQVPPGGMAGRHGAPDYLKEGRRGGAIGVHGRGRAYQGASITRPRTAPGELRCRDVTTVQPSAIGVGLEVIETQDFTRRY